MNHSTANKGQCRYRYYVCRKALTQGYSVCPAPSVPELLLEQEVLARVRQLPIDVERLAASEIPSAAAIWSESSVPPDEQARLLRLILERVEYDARGQVVRFALTPRAAEVLMSADRDGAQPACAAPT